MARLPTYTSQTQRTTGGTRTPIPADDGFSRVTDAVARTAGAYRGMRQRQEQQAAADGYNRYKQDIEDWFADARINRPEDVNERGMLEQQYREFEAERRAELLGDISDSDVLKRYQGLTDVYADSVGNVVLTDQAAAQAEAAQRTVDTLLADYTTDIEAGVGDADLAETEAEIIIRGYQLPEGVTEPLVRMSRDRIRGAAAVSSISNSEDPREAFDAISGIRADSSMTPTQKADAISRGHAQFQQRYNLELHEATTEIDALNVRAAEADAAGDSRLAAQLRARAASVADNIKALKPVAEQTRAAANQAVRTEEAAQATVDIGLLQTELQNPDANPLDIMQQIAAMRGSLQGVNHQRANYLSLMGSFSSALSGIRSTEATQLGVDVSQNIADGKYDEAQTAVVEYLKANPDRAEVVTFAASADKAITEAKLTDASQELIRLGALATEQMANDRRDLADATLSRIGELATAYPELEADFIKARTTVQQHFSNSDRQVVGSRFDTHLISAAGNPEQLREVMDMGEAWYEASDKLPTDEIAVNAMRAAYVRALAAGQGGGSNTPTAAQLDSAAGVELYKTGASIPPDTSASVLKGVDLAYATAEDQLVASGASVDDIAEFRANRAGSQRRVFDRIKSNFRVPPTTEQGFELNVRTIQALNSDPRTAMLAQELPNYTKYAAITELVSDGWSMRDALQAFRTEASMTPAESSANKTQINDFLVSMPGVSTNQADAPVVEPGDDPFGLGTIPWGSDVDVPRYITEQVMDNARAFNRIVQDPAAAVAMAKEMATREFGHSSLAGTEGPTVAARPIEREYFGNNYDVKDSEQGDILRGAIVAQLMDSPESRGAIATQSRPATFPLPTLLGTSLSLPSPLSPLVTRSDTSDEAFEEYLPQIRDNLYVAPNPDGSYTVRYRADDVFAAPVVLHNEFRPDRSYINTALDRGLVKESDGVISSFFNSAAWPSASQRAGWLYDTITGN